MSEGRRASPGGPPDDATGGEELLDLLPVIRRVVQSRVKDPHLVEDLVQETLLRVMAARERVEADTLAPYAAVTARNLVASWTARNDRDRGRAHLLADLDVPEAPLEDLLRQEKRALLAAALARLPAVDRDVLLAHEVDGEDTRSLAARRSWAAPARGSAWSTSWSPSGSSRRATAVARCCAPCPPATAAGRPSSTRAGTC